MEIIEVLSQIVAWLLVTSLKAAVVFSLIMLIRFVFQDRLPARWQHAMWFLLIIRLVLPLEIPSSLSIFNLAMKREADTLRYFEYRDLVQQGAEETVISPFATVAVEPSNVPDAARQINFGLDHILTVLWLTGVLCYIIILLVTNIRIRRCIRQVQRVQDGWAYALFENCAKRMGLKRLPELYVHATAHVPFSCGIRSPRIVIPVQFIKSLSESQLRHIFLHEMAHIKRYDLLFALVTSLLQAIYWFNPFVWLAFLMMRYDRETACDEKVLAALGESEKYYYGETLISLLRQTKTPSLLPAIVGLADTTSNLKKRVRRIANYTKKSRGWAIIGFIFIAAISIITMTTAQRGTPDVQKIYLNIRHADEIGMPWSGTYLNATMQLPFWEESISAYPQGYEIVRTFWWRFDVEAYNITNAHQSEEFYRKIIEQYGQAQFDSLSMLYPDQPVDCMLTFALIEKDGQTFIVFDENNDDNLADDAVRSFTSEEQIFSGKQFSFQKCQAQTMLAMANGKNIEQQIIPVGVIKEKKDGCSIGNLNVAVGQAYIGGKKFSVAFPFGSSVGLTPYSNFILDSNSNGKWDQGDDQGQIFRPFTMAGCTFEVDDLDPNGTFVTLRKSDQKVYPPIKIGAQAPDFQLPTLDGKDFRLSGLHGKIVLLDFWGTWCGPCLKQVDYLKDAYKKFHPKGLEIVSVGIDDPERLKKFVQEKEMNWVHIQQNKNEQLEKLYQIGSYPTVLLLNQHGIIVESGISLEDEELEKTLNKCFIK
jgi:beta-lactamase regulating signal transducer with metallopeptidase domain/peroxiredoxin